MEQNANTANPATPAGKTNGGDAAQPTATNEGNPGSLTREEIDNLLTEKIQQVINPLAAQLRRITQQHDQPKPQTTQAETSVAERLKAIEQREAKQRERQRVTAVKEAALSSGVDGKRVDVLTSFILAKYSTNIKVNDDDAVLYVDEFEQSKPLNDFVTNFLKSPDGEMFRPALNAPNARGLRGGPGITPGKSVPYSELPNDVRWKMSAAEQTAYIRANG